MIKQIKTKEEVIIDPISGEKGKVVLTLDSIAWHGNVFHASSHYQPEGTSTIMHQASASFTTEEADQLFAYFQIPQGTFVEMFTALAINTMMIEIENKQFFGLTASGWEDYVPEVETVEEVIDPLDE